MPSEGSSSPVVVPVPSSLTQFYWDGAREGRLLLQRCQDCKHFIHPPRVICRHCLSQDLRPEQVSGNATLYTWTVNQFPAPRIVISVEIPEEPGLKLVSNLIDCEEDDLVMGMPLEVAFTEVTPEVTLPVFRRRTAHGTTVGTV